MTPNELFKSGALAKAIDAQIAEVRGDPGDQGKRLFLFELTAFAGDLDRAQRQIEAIQYDDPKLMAAVVEYRKMLDVERTRRLVFDQSGAPSFFGPSAEHVAKRLQALPLLKTNPAEAAALLQAANDQAPLLKGACNDKPFDFVRDADDRFGTALEVFAQGVYYWVPFEDIQAITLNPPRFPRDLLLAPAHLELRSGSAGNVFLPTVYPGSHECKDPMLQLGRTTEWHGETPAIGVGAKTFLVGDDGLTILEWRKLTFAA